MIRFSHTFNTWQLYVGRGLWMFIDPETARDYANRDYRVAV